jgi:hypothetical protein
MGRSRNIEVETSDMASPSAKSMDGVENGDEVDRFQSAKGNLSPSSQGGQQSTLDDPQRKKDENSGDAADDKEIQEGGPSTKKQIKLYKSPRFQGYLTILLSSIINYHSVDVSQNVSGISTVVPSSQQIAYGITVALISSIVSGLCVFCHLDNFSCLAKIWKEKLFAPKSKFEVMLDLFLLLWWFIATCVQTGVRGIAGDGKEQFNIYYSTWFCAFSALSMLESKMAEYDWPTIKKFVKSWPNRAPGWIAIFVSDFFLLFWYVDLYINTAQNPDRVTDSLVPFWGEIPDSQYEWLIFAASVTLLPSSAFILAEIVRDSSKENSGKMSWETNAEGICLLLLTLGWIPSVVVATTPGGLASNIGNAYFFTWATTVFVLQTAVWFVHDSRSGVHQTIMQQEKEYRQHQLDVLEATKKLQQEASILREETDRGKEGDVSGWGSPHTFGNRKETEDLPIFGKILSPTEDLRTVPLTGMNAVQVPAPADGGSDMTIFEDDEVMDETIRQEIRMREANRRAYFDTLDDILE